MTPDKRKAEAKAQNAKRTDPLDPVNFVAAPGPQPDNSQVEDGTTQEEEVKAEGQDAPASTEPDDDVFIRASSVHLCLASKSFEKMLRGPWLEGSSGGNGTPKTCTASEWDTDAFLTVLNIIHGHHRAVPKEVSLEKLARIAAIIDYYDCHEITEVFVQMWIAPLNAKRSTVIGKEGMLWIFVSSIFRNETIFVEMARTTIAEAQGPLQSMELPFPPGLLGSFSPPKLIDLKLSSQRW